MRNIIGCLWERQTHLCDARHELVIYHLPITNLSDVDLRCGCCLEEEPRDVRPVPMSVLPLLGLPDKTLVGFDATMYDSGPYL